MTNQLQIVKSPLVPNFNDFILHNGHKKSCFIMIYLNLPSKATETDYNS